MKEDNMKFIITLVLLIVEIVFIPMIAPAWLSDLEFWIIYLLPVGLTVIAMLKTLGI